MQTLYSLGFHCTGIHFPHLDPARGDNGVLHWAGSRNDHREMFQDLQQSPALFPGDIMDLLPGRYLRGPHDFRNQLLRQQVIQGVAEIMVAVLLKITQKTAVKGLLVQSRFQIDFQMIRPFAESPHMS